MKETWIWSLSWEDPLEKDTATHSRVLAWRILGQRSLQTIVHGVTTNLTWLKRISTQHACWRVWDDGHLSSSERQMVGLLWKHIYSSPLFFNQVQFLTLSWVRSLYILNINPLLNTLFANIFSYSAVCISFVDGSPLYAKTFKFKIIFICLCFILLIFISFCFFICLLVF